jgi:uncharacterized coiled-coil protein SlyX
MMEQSLATRAINVIKEQREMIDLYTKLDAQQQRTISTQQEHLARQRDMIQQQQELIRRLYEEIDNLHDRLEAQ